MTMSDADRKRTRRVLIYRLGSLGDTIIALPPLHLVAQAFPDAERRMLTSFPPQAKAPASSMILEGTGLVHGYLRYTYGTRDIRELLALWWRIVRWRPEVLVYMSGPRGIGSARRDLNFFRLCLIRRFVGVPLTEGMQERRPRRRSETITPGLEGPILEHESSRLVRNLAELGAISLEDPSSWDLHLSVAESTRADEALSPLKGRSFIAVSLGTKNQSNDWGIENWRALLARLAKLYPDLGLVFCGAADEVDSCEAAASGWRENSSGPVLNLCGAITPRESAAVLKRALIFLGHDSGPTHLAAAVQTPCVSVYGARNLPGIWFPYGRNHRVLYHRVDCAGCLLSTCIVEKKKCVLSIQVEEVLSQVIDSLNSLTVSAPGISSAPKANR